MGMLSGVVVAIDSGEPAEGLGESRALGGSEGMMDQGNHSAPKGTGRIAALASFLSTAQEPQSERDSSEPHLNGGPESTAVLEGKRTTFRAGAFLIAGLGLVAFLNPTKLALLLSLHAAWAVQLAVLGELVARRRLSPATCGIISSAGGIALLPCILLATSHATESVLYPALVCMPLVIAAVAPDDRGSVAIFSLGGLGWIVALGVIGQDPTWQVVAQAGFAVVCDAIAVFATLSYRRARALERRLMDEKLSALEQLRESERRRASSERMVLLGQLSAGVAHEINNPLAFVSSNFSFLQKEARRRAFADPDIDGAFQDTEEGLQRIQQIVRDLKSVSHSERLAPVDGEVCGPAEAVSEAIRVASLRLRGIATIENRVTVDCPTVAIPRGRLVQVLLNLLLNAVDAIEAAARGDAGRITIGFTRESAEVVQLTVEDTGAGIPAEVLPRIFDPFFTTKASDKGTGLGLALSRQYVTEAGGSISAANRPEGGVRFVVSLPVATSA